MRGIRNTLTFFAVTALMCLAGCDNATAPDPQIQIDLPPFGTQLYTVAFDPTCQSCAYGNSIKFFAPSGVAPLIDVTAEDIPGKSSAGVKIDNVVLTPDPDHVCTSACTQVAWEAVIVFEVAQVGEANVTMALHDKPEKKSTFHVVSKTFDPFGGKG